MQVIERNGVKIYNVSVGKVTPQWTAYNKQKVRVYPNNPGPGEMELIQEFAFPIFASKIKYSLDGESILASGMHPPQIKNFSTENVSMKWNRHLDAEVVDFQILNPDATKIAILRVDRYVEFHSKSGFYYKLRIPAFGRAMTYNPLSTELNLVGNSKEIYRLNLEHGRFFESYSTSLSDISCIDINPNFGFLSVGGVGGIVECWDPRDRKSLASLKINCLDLDNSKFASLDISTLKFFPNGLTLAVGTTSGYVLLYDLRSSVPYKVKDHQFDMKIQNIDFHPRSGQVISSCRRVVRIWDQNSDSSFANIEPPWEINDVLVLPDTGLIMMAGENPRMHIYYIPELGSPPKWASFLDNITEELMEVEGTSVYQDYRFLTQKELENLNITNLIGTPYLKAYMHGYFIDNRLYSRIRAIVKPEEYKNYLKQKLEEKLEAERGSRIAAQHKTSKVPVNSQYLESLRRSNSKVAESLANDPRFERMFNDPMMKVDPDSKKFENSKMTRLKHRLKSKETSLQPNSDSSYNGEDDENEKRHDDDDPIGELEEYISPKIVKPSFIEPSERIATVVPKKPHIVKISNVESDEPFCVVKENIHINTPFTTRLKSEKSLCDTTDKNLRYIGPIKTTFTPEIEKVKPSSKKKCHN